jgi:hypothetical protein
MLDWSTTEDIDRSMRRFVGIPDNELVIALIGFGNMPECFKVPRSQRKPLGEVLRLSRPCRGSVPTSRLRPPRFAAPTGVRIGTGRCRMGEHFEPRRYASAMPAGSEPADQPSAVEPALP